MKNLYHAWLSGIRSRLILLTLLSMIPVALVIIHSAVEARDINSRQAVENLATLAAVIRERVEAGHEDPLGAVEHLTAMDRAAVRTPVATLWDPEGRVLARAPDTAGPAGGDSAEADLLREVRTQGGHAGTLESAGLDGVTRGYAYTVFGSDDERRIVTVGLSTDVLFSEVDALFQRTLLLLGAVFLFALGIAWLLGEVAVRRPVGRLASAARQISDGRLNVRVGDIHGASELTTLAGAFDRMVENLEQYEQEQEATQQKLSRSRDELEEKVRERTDQLARASDAATERAASLERQRKEMTVLNELTDLLQSCRTLDETRAIIQRSLGELFAGLSGTVYLFSEDGHSLERITGWGEHHEEHLDTFAPDDCWALRLGRIWVYDPEARNPACRHDGNSEIDSICAPMHAEGKTLGVLHVAGGAHGASPGESAGENERLVDATAARLGLALSNIRLREALRNLTIRDPLTGLYNRRFVDETLEPEVERCRRAERPLSVLMLDVDHFKQFNDTYGHDAGDVVLVAVAHLLQKLFTGPELPCRLGGEEFLVILPEADGDRARDRAEELREAIAELALFHQGRSLGTVTTSVGVATWPEPVSEPDALIDAADAALYEAKDAGRNRVMLVGDATAGAGAGG